MIRTASSSSANPPSAIPGPLSPRLPGVEGASRVGGEKVYRVLTGRLRLIFCLHDEVAIAAPHDELVLQVAARVLKPLFAVGRMPPPLGLPFHQSGQMDLNRGSIRPLPSSP